MFKAFDHITLNSWQCFNVISSTLMFRISITQQVSHVIRIHKFDSDTINPELQFISIFKAIIIISSKWKSKIHVPVAIWSWKCNSYPDSYTSYMGIYKTEFSCNPMTMCNSYSDSYTSYYAMQFPKPRCPKQFIFRFKNIILCHVIPMTMCNSYSDSYTSYSAMQFPKPRCPKQFIFRFIYITLCHVISQSTLSKGNRLLSGVSGCPWASCGSWSYCICEVEVHKRKLN